MVQMTSKEKTDEILLAVLRLSERYRKEVGANGPLDLGIRQIGDELLMLIHAVDIPID